MDNGVGLAVYPLSRLRLRSWLLDPTTLLMLWRLSVLTSISLRKGILRTARSRKEIDDMLSSILFFVNVSDKLIEVSYIAK